MLPFTSAVKYGAVTFKNGTWLLGAPEFVLKSIAAPLKKQIGEYTLKGYRACLFRLSVRSAYGKRTAGGYTSRRAYSNGKRHTQKRARHIQVF